MNLLELWDFEKSKFFQEVGSQFHKRFDQLFDHTSREGRPDFFQELQTSSKSFFMRNATTMSQEKPQTFLGNAPVSLPLLSVEALFSDDEDSDPFVDLAD